MTHEEFYGDSLDILKAAEQHLTGLITGYPGYTESEDGLQTLLYFRSRIKSPESMMTKLKSRGLTADRTSAIKEVNDAVGVRAVCAFTDDVYRLADWLMASGELELVNKKDYIAFPKPNGYRSLHLIVKILEGPGSGLNAEIQIRTIATDFWAALEHQMKYKREISDAELISRELKLCADDIASVDLSMQTLRDVIRNKI